MYPLVYVRAFDTCVIALPFLSLFWYALNSVNSRREVRSRPGGPAVYHEVDVAEHRGAPPRGAKQMDRAVAQILSKIILAFFIEEVRKKSQSFIKPRREVRSRPGRPAGDHEVDAAEHHGAASRGAEQMDCALAQGALGLERSRLR